MADALMYFFGGVLACLAAAGFGFGFIQNRKAKKEYQNYEKEREQKVQALMESAHELAKTKVDSIPNDQLLAESNKRLSARIANKSAKE